MIVSKPKGQSQFALWVFISVSLIISLFLITNYQGQVLYLIGIIVFLPLGIILAFRNTWFYKILYFRKKSIEVKFPLRFKKTAIHLKAIDWWKEEEVKTWREPFRQITIKSGNVNIKFANQEFSNYTQVRNFLLKNVRKKQQKG